jgi:hypothetical protein
LPSTLIAVIIALAALTLSSPSPSLLHSNLVAIAMAYFVLIPTPLAALANTFFISRH